MPQTFDEFLTMLDTSRSRSQQCAEAVGVEAPSTSTFAGASCAANYGVLSLGQTPSNDQLADIGTKTSPAPRGGGIFDNRLTIAISHLNYTLRVTGGVKY